MCACMRIHVSVYMHACISCVHVRAHVCVHVCISRSGHNTNLHTQVELDVHTLHRQVYRIQYRTWNIDHTRHGAYQCLLVPVTYTHSHSHHSLPLGWCYTETSYTVFSDISPPTTDLLILTSVVTSVGTLLILRVYQPLCQELSQMT